MQWRVTRSPHWYRLSNSSTSPSIETGWENQTMDDAAPAVVRVRAGRTADKRRSWHVARVASDIQRSLADQSSTSQARSSWHPNDDWSSPYHHQGSGWATTADSGVSGDQVEHKKASFSIASWVDRPSSKEMDATVAHYTTTPESLQHPQYQQPNSSSDDSQDENIPPIVIVPVTLSTIEQPDDQVPGQLKRLVSTTSDTYIEVVVRELRGATPWRIFPFIWFYLNPTPSNLSILTRSLNFGAKFSVFFFLQQMNVKVYKRRRSKNGSIPI